MSSNDGKMMQYPPIKTGSVNIMHKLYGNEYWSLFLLFTIIILSFNSPGTCRSEEKAVTSGTESATAMKMTKAVICEEAKDGQPLNENVIFSSELTRITCYTEFDKIAKKTTIYHCWYFKNNLSAKKMPLVLNPPHWCTFSQIQPRETDKGPWRVEIVDEDGNIIQTLRFSIVD